MFQWVDRYKISNKKARSFDGKDLGKIKEVENNYVLIEGESKFYIPTYFIQKYEDGNLWFKIDEDEAKSRFMILKELVRVGSSLIPST
jgi:hypothetical protein